MPYKQLLEEYPLYRRLAQAVPGWTHELDTPSLHLFCGLCKSDQTFVLTNDYDVRLHGQHRQTPNLLFRAVYDCAGCSKFQREFFLKVDAKRTAIWKVGQFPAWEINVDKGLGEMLGDHVDFYKKGLVCESQGYGIGAYAYYRRIIEAIIDELLNSISDLIPPNERKTYADALAETKKTIVAQKKIELVKDLLPPVLRPEGHNPLSLLHSLLSEGLHGRSEEHCLEDAAHIRDTLVFLVNQVIQSRSSAKQFTESMKKLLQKKSEAASNSSPAK